MLTLVVAGLVVTGCGGSSKKKSSTATPPTSVGVSVAQLRALAKSVGHPVYWAGPKAGYTYELTKVVGGIIDVRYLPPGIAVGDPRPDFLAVGTYPQTSPQYAKIRAAAKRKHAKVRKVKGRGIAVSYRSRPSSVYLVYPGKTLTVETFDPSPTRAMRLVTSGRIVPIR